MDIYMVILHLRSVRWK